jgi:hypothetical protein
MRKILIAASFVALPLHAEPFIDVGVNGTRIESRIANSGGPVDTTEAGAHFGIGASRSIGERSDLSLRLELDNLGSDMLLSVRALDFRRHLSDKLALNAFAGATRLDLATPAYGYYYGVGLQVKELISNWDLGIDFRVGDEVARDNLLPSDPQGGMPDNFYNIVGLSVYLSFRF